MPEEQIGPMTPWKRAKEFFLANPTAVLSLLYLFATAIGMLYSWILYASFGISIFDYSEIADFLLAAFKNPVALLSIGLLGAMGAVITNFMADWTMRYFFNLVYEENRADRIRSVERKLSWLNRGILVIVPLTILLVALIFPYYYAGKMASDIKDGETLAVDVRYRTFSTSTGQARKPGLQLIGATQKFVFFYDVDSKRTLVIPQAQIVSIEVPE